MNFSVRERWDVNASLLLCFGLWYSFTCNCCCCFCCCWIVIATQGLLLSACVSRSRGAPGHCVCMCPVDNDDSEKKQQCCDTLRSIQRRCGHWASGRCPRECSMRILHTYTQTTTSERSAKHPSWYSVAVIRPSLITLSHQFFFIFTSCGSVVFCYPMKCSFFLEGWM